MEKPQYIDWIVEETGIVIKDDIPLKYYKMIQININIQKITFYVDKPKKI